MIVCTCTRIYILETMSQSNIHINISTYSDKKSANPKHLLTYNTYRYVVCTRTSISEIYVVKSLLICKINLNFSLLIFRIIRLRFS